MKKILIFGSNGLLGQNIAVNFSKNHELWGASLEKENFLTNLDLNYKTTDIADRKLVKEIIGQIKPDIIINAAAYTNVDGCESENELYWDVNVKAVENMVESAVALKPIFVHISTDYIFDGFNAPYREDDKPNPRGNYARSKMASENIVRSSKLEYLLIRTQILYGTGHRIRPNFVTWLIDQLKNKNPVRVVDDQVGNPTYVRDLSIAISRLLKAKSYGVFHVSGPDSLSRYDFALKIADVFGLDSSLISRIKTKELNQAAPRPQDSTFKIDKLINNSGGWKPHSLIAALKLLKKELNNLNG